MRMRQLGNGHSVEFLASFEADLRIQELCKTSIITSEHVMEFIWNNSCKFEIENTVFWVAAAYNYTKKIAAFKLFDFSQNQIHLYNGCCEKEFITLQDMYSDRKEQLLSDINSNKFATLSNSYRGKTLIQDYIKSNAKAMQKILNGPGANIKRHVHVLDEEQERERETETEREIEDQRQHKQPPPFNAVISKDSSYGNLEELILHGWNKRTSALVQPLLFLLPKGLQKTKMYQEYIKCGDAFAKHIYVTNDFINVVDTSSQACDEFLRPVRWIARIDGTEENSFVLILISSFECDRLLPAFRRSTKSILYPFSTQLSKFHNDLLAIKDLYVTGKTKTVGINVDDVVQIKMFAGSMYFNDENEQNKYCQFMSLIPRPRTQHQENYFAKGIIKPNGYVPVEHRQNFENVRLSKFTRNPTDLAIKLIECRHQCIRKESHVAYILERGEKFPFNNENSK